MEKTTPLFHIIIPVYNAFSQTMRCVESVLKNSSLPFKLIIINDCSDKIVAAELSTFAAADARILVINNNNNLGFLASANAGLAYEINDSASPEIKILLNSDTIVFPGWLEAFQKCFASDIKIGLACPVSNNAENLTVSMPEGTTISRISQAVSSLPNPQYPDITTAIGFCMAIRTSVIRELGLFDKIFARGYGEDSDYHFRAICEGYRSVLVDNCFVYHEADASFTTSKMDNIRQNRPIFDQRWLGMYVNEIEYHNATKPLKAVSEHITKSFSQPVEHDVLFILPSAKLYGGVIVAYEILNHLSLLGLNVGVIINSESEEVKMPIFFTPYFFTPERWLEQNIPPAKIYVATHHETVKHACKAHANHPSSKLCYLIQGYEGWFRGARLEDVICTYKAIPHRIAISTWLQTMLAKLNLDAEVISNGVDTKFFTPRDTFLDPIEKNVRLLLLAREDPQGSWGFTLELLQLLSQHSDIDVITVGPASLVPQVAAYSKEALGFIDRREMAKVLRSCDILVDCSMIQGFGLMGLEAMASGVATVLTHTGGVREYANESNSLLVPPGNTNALYQAVISLSKKTDLLLQLKRAGRETALQRDWHAIALSYKNYFLSLIANGKSLSSENLSALNDFYFQQLQQKQIAKQRINHTAFHLVEEMRTCISTPLSIEEIAARCGLTENLKYFAPDTEGELLRKLYDYARGAVERATQRNEVLSELINNKPYETATLLEKVISISKSVN